VREQTRRDEQARKNGDAARAGVEKLADFRQQATEDAWKSMESSVDAASRGFQNASDQFARTLGFSGEEGERLARQSGQNVEAITKFGTVLTQAYQDTSREWYGLAQKQLQRNFEGLRARPERGEWGLIGRAGGAFRRVLKPDLEVPCGPRLPGGTIAAPAFVTKQT
jgi:hypothetical protein